MRVTIIKKDSNKWGYGEVAGKNVKWYSFFRKHLDSSLTNSTQELPYDPAIPLLDILPKGIEKGIFTHILVHICL